MRKSNDNVSRRGKVCVTVLSLRIQLNEVRHIFGLKDRDYDFINHTYMSCQYG